MVHLNRLQCNLLAYAINAALKNVGQTLVVRQMPRSPRTIDISQLAADINDGRIKHLFILGGDPVYNAPRGLAEDKQKNLPLDWGELQKRVPEIVRLGYHEDATSTLSQWHVPAAHYLESWGDALTSDGDYLSIQPMILPIFGGLSEIELLNALLGGPKIEGPELVQETFRSTNPRAIFKLRGRVSFTMVLQRTFSRVISPRLSMQMQAHRRIKVRGHCRQLPRPILPRLC